MMMAYILIVVVTACGSSTCGVGWSTITMQRFATAKACQFASVKLLEISDYPNRTKVVCVPEEIK